jgi:hypothetical protein
MKKFKTAIFSILLFVSHLGSTFADSNQARDVALGALVGIWINDMYSKRPVYVLPDNNPNYTGLNQPQGHVYTCNVQVINQYGQKDIQQKVCVR